MNVLGSKKITIQGLKPNIVNTTLLPEKFEVCEIIAAQSKESPVHFQMVPLRELVYVCNEARLGLFVDSLVFFFCLAPDDPSYVLREHPH